MIVVKEINTPLGQMLAGATDEGICLFDFKHRRSIDAIVNRVFTHLGRKSIVGHHDLFSDLEQQLTAYFAGTLRDFSLPLQFAGSPFQAAVWQSLLAIPYGQTSTYGKQAEAIGSHAATRAVAAANGANAIAIIVPCHRVIGANGNLTGYSGGIDSKKWLLQHERRSLGEQAELFM
jgi:AraC family transcriptional regulator, regulatory protein of adaptative response / methylated-DNA-[protein]-cysteine methyltransferase